VRDVVAKHGLFCSLYTDRGSHYFFTPEAGGRVSDDGAAVPLTIPRQKGEIPLAC
jgi:hypothetical protein